jgi:hypothetical protein
VGGRVGTEQKSKGRLECDTRKNSITNRVKNKLIQKCVLGRLSAQGWKLSKTTMNKYEQRVTCSKKNIERCGSSLLTSNRKNELGKRLMISKRNRKRKVL